MKLPKWVKRWGPAAASAALLAFAFPPLNFVLLTFVAIAPWLANLRQVDGKGALKSSAVYGAVTILFQMFWLVLFINEWTHNMVAAIVPWLVCGFLGALIYLPMGWLINKCWKLGWPWLIPIVWAGHEAFRAYIPVLAFPWGILANPLWIFPQFVQHAALGTVFFVSAWVVIPNLVLAMILWPKDGKPPPSRQTLQAAIVFGGVMLVSVYRYANPPSTEKKIVTLGQPGVDMAFTPKDIQALDMRSAGLWIQNRAATQGTDLLVLPEGFSPNDPRVAPYSPIGQEPLVPVLMGGVRPDGASTYETAYGYDGKWTYADKTRLVIFGEFVPFRELPFLQSFNLPKGDLSPAKKLSTVSVKGVTIGPLLCFEGVFPDLADRHGRLGARLLAQLCIDDWYERTPAWEQLWQSSIWRSIESGLPLVRVGGRGQSLATDARGNVTVMVRRGILTAERVEVGVPEKSDAFPFRMGFVYLSWAVCAVIGTSGLWRKNKVAPAE
ncbi:MAG: apolipoprotein N-acyltransferase [Armatimonadetes bacterium]|nr:apolipoprotein N-acyltransferase [Armatimonadota bacterium]